MNTSHSAIKRLLNEYKDFSKNPSPLIHAVPLSPEKNLFEWHFSIRGPIESPFEGGVYHGRILLPTDYPYKPPDVMLLTPNGRFECHKKICLNVTSFHRESWHPGCSIRTLLLSLRMFFLEQENGVGSIKYNDEDRTKLATESLSWKCDHCDLLMQDVPFAPGGEEKPRSVSEQEKSKENSHREENTTSVNLPHKEQAPESESQDDPLTSSEDTSKEHLASLRNHHASSPPTRSAGVTSSVSIAQAPSSSLLASSAATPATTGATSSASSDSDSTNQPALGVNDNNVSASNDSTSTAPNHTAVPNGTLGQQAREKSWDEVAMQTINFLLAATALGIMAILWQKLLVD